MSILISAAATIFTYLVLMQLLFEDYDEFSSELRSTILYFPISVVLDYSFRQRPHPRMDLDGIGSGDRTYRLFIDI
jgi:hypothetical protein